MTSFRARFLRPSVTTLSVLASWIAGRAGCETGDSNTNPRPLCPPDAGTDCVGPTGGGSNSSGGGSTGSSGQGGSSGTNDVTGNVGVLSEVSFSQVSPYIGASTIITTSNAGMSIDTPYGEMKTSFTLLDVRTGPTWFYVQDQTVGATGIFSTHSVVNVPVSGSVTLPVVDRSVMQSIAGMLPSPIVIDGTRGVMVLKIVRNGQPLSGVSLTTPLPGSTTVYDAGVGLYSNQVQQTGPAGVILAFNVDGPSSAQLIDLTLTDVNQQSFFVQVRYQAGSATFAGFEL